MLLKHGAHVTKRNNDDLMPLHLAFRFARVPIIELLLKHGNAHKVTIDLFLELLPVDISLGSRGLTHFQVARTRSNVDQAEAFLKKGVLLS